jgi:hypothetical protein
VKSFNSRLDEIDSNNRAFQKLLNNLLPSHKGDFALMRLGQIVDFYSSRIEAYYEGERRFSRDHLYSIHQVAVEPKVVGYYWNAELKRQDRPEDGLHLPENHHDSEFVRSGRLESTGQMSHHRTGHWSGRIRDLY